MQRRSTARVSAILDGCAELLEKLDYDELTTSKIAERAGVPIGSLYQYFPDKRAVVRAVALRNMDAFTAEIELIFSGSRAPAEWREAVDAVLDGYLRLLDRVPGFGRVRFGDVIDVLGVVDGEDNNGLVAARLCELFTRDHGGADCPELRLACRVVVEVGNVMVKLAARSPREQRSVVLHSAGEIIRGVLARHLD